MGIATTGPIPITSGGTPPTAKLNILPSIGNPCALAKDLLASITTAAPSVTYEEFPAVVLPPFLKAGFSFPSPATVVSALTPSSVSTTIVLEFPSLSLTVVVIGVISYFKSLSLLAAF